MALGKERINWQKLTPYEIVDITLNSAKEKESHFQTNIYSTNMQQALQIIEEYDLLRFRNPSDKNMSIFDITSKGLVVLEAGGIKNFIDGLQQKKNIEEEHKEIVNRLQFEKLQSEVWKINNEINDYPATKLRSKAGIWLSGTAIIVSVILQVINWKCK